jgi:sugar phosphate isomerase/epimerase
MLHLKDARGGDADGDCPIGEGVIEWPLVLAAAEDTGVRWLIVEQEDAPDDALRDIRTSLENLRTIRSALAEIRD